MLSFSAVKKLFLPALLACTMLMGCASSFAQNVGAQAQTKMKDGTKIMKIALCHLEVSCGPMERNLNTIAKALRVAGELGADVAVTPETSVQGYYFYRIDPTAKVDVQPVPYLDQLRSITKEYGMYLLLGCGEYDEADGRSYNSCLVFNPKGELQSRHRKIFNEHMGSEAWASAAKSVSVTDVDGAKVGVLVCADSWFDPRPLSLQEQGAQLIIDCAAWPATKETGDPVPSWEKASRITGLPFVLCNQTGKTQWMDMSIGESVVVENAKTKFRYSGQQAVLLFEWDAASGKIISDEFEVYPL